MVYPVEFKVKGISNYYDEFFKKFGEENEDYNLPNAEIKSEYSDGDKVFQYSYSFNEVKLVPEPDNKYDPNAIRVEVDGVLLGYIDKAKTERVKELLASPDFRYIKLDVGGGAYKYIYEDEDEKLQIDQNECGPFADVSIYMNKEFESEPTVTTEPIKKVAPRGLVVVELVLGVILGLMSLLLLLLSPVAGVLVLIFAVILIVFGVKGLKKPKEEGR